MSYSFQDLFKVVDEESLLELGSFLRDLLLLLGNPLVDLAGLLLIHPKEVDSVFLHFIAQKSLEVGNWLLGRILVNLNLLSSVSKLLRPVSRG